LFEGESQVLERDELGPDLVGLVQDRPRWEAERAALTVFDSTGWALEDLVAAELVLEHAERFELGIVVDLLPIPRDPYDPYEAVRG
jgi:ornithine cyclodeaminase/alanine dehydrogenase-like protein (mu-crystallin family)